MGNTDEEQLKDQLEAELDVLSFLDACEFTFRDVIELVFRDGVPEETRGLLERLVR